MKIANRKFLAKNIKEYTDTDFVASYKNHHIEISVQGLKGSGNIDWNVDVRHFDGSYAVQSIFNSPTIFGAIEYALDGALL